VFFRLINFCNKKFLHACWSHVLSVDYYLEVVSPLLVATDATSKVHHGDANEAAFTPVSAPAVLDDPVAVGVGSDAVAHGDDCVIDGVVPAAGVVQDTRSVATEEGGLTVDVSHEGTVNVQRIDDVSNWHSTALAPGEATRDLSIELGGGASLACALEVHVAIVSFLDHLNFVGDHPVNDVARVSSRARARFRVAIKKHLWRHHLQAVSWVGDVVIDFRDCCNCESPASTTSLLVFWRVCTVSTPIFNNR